MKTPVKREAGPFKIDGEQCWLLELTQGMWMIVDSDDLPRLRKRFWNASKNKSGKYYCVSNGTAAQSRVSAHRYIMRAQDGHEVDHRNGNTFDNRKSNLRVATKKQNNCNVDITVRNTSGFKGVSYCKRTGRYRAQIRVEGRNRSLGYRDTPEEAAELYAEAAMKYHGEFAKF